MKLLACALFAIAVAGTGCSKSSAKPTPAAEAKPVVVEPATDPCDDACTSYGQCYEVVYKGETFKGGDGCVETCKQRPAADQVAWAKELATAVSTKQCATVITAEEEGGGEDDDEAGMADGEPSVTLPADLELGCFGWSMQLRTAACITGDDGTDGKNLKLVFIGAENFAPLPLGAGDLAKANAKLAQEGFSALKVSPAALQNRKPKTLNGATLRFTTVGSNHYALVVAFNGGTTPLFETEGEGLTVKANARAIGVDHVLVELASHTAREGEMTDRLEVALLDVATGKVAR